MSPEPDPGSSGGDAERAQEQQAQIAAARQRFTLLARRPEESIDLAEACLQIAAEEYPGLDVPAYLSRLDDLAARVSVLARTSARAETANDDEAVLRALHQVLFEEEGFQGDPIDEQFHPYYQPRCSFLNDVLDRKRGMPITLSVLYMEVARRAGLDAAGIGLPGHFIAEFRGAHFSALVDPYSRGRRLTPEERGQLPTEFLQPTAKKQILARMLTNLKQAYRVRGPLPKALSAVERLLLLNPSLDQVRDRGLILAQMNMPGPAWFDLKLYARLAQGAPDAAGAAEAADKLWRQMGRMN